MEKQLGELGELRKDKTGICNFYSVAKNNQ